MDVLNNEEAWKLICQDAKEEVVMQVWTMMDDLKCVDNLGYDFWYL